jgi:hypothetical protein
MAFCVSHRLADRLTQKLVGRPLCEFNDVHYVIVIIEIRSSVMCQL